MNPGRMYYSTLYHVCTMLVPATGEHVTIVINTTAYLVVPTYMKPIALERSQVSSYSEKVNKAGCSTVTKSNIKMFTYFLLKH